MRTHLPFTLALSLLLWFPAMAGEFSRVVPADSFLYLEVKDMPGLIKKQSETPFGRGLAELDWKTPLIQLVQSMDPAESSPDSQEALRAVLNRLETEANRISMQLNGSWAMAMGDFTTPFTTFRTHQDIRSDLLFETQMDAYLEEEDPALLAQLEKERELDMIELATIAGEVVFFADINDPEMLQSILNDIVKELEPQLNELKKVSYETQDHEGITLHEISYTHSDNVPSIGLHWAVHEKVWVTGFTSAALKTALGHLTTPPEAPLWSVPDVQETYPAPGTSDSYTYINLPLTDQWLRMGLEQAPALPQTGSFTPEAFLEWLGLDALYPATQTSLLTQEGSTTQVRLGFREETGLSRLLLSEPEPVELPSFLHRDLAQFSVVNWSIGEFWTRLETELMGLAPEAAAGLGMARMLATGQLGFDIKLQFFDHLDSGLVFAQTLDPQVMAELNEAMEAEDPSAILAANAKHPTGGQNYLVGFEIKDEQPIHTAMDRLMTRFFPQGAPEPEEVDGVDVFNPVPPGAAGGMIDQLIHFASVDGWLLISVGERDLLDQAIKASRDETLQVRNDPEFLALRATLPAEAFQLDFTSGEQQEEAMNMAKASLEMMAPEGLDVPDLSFLADFYDSILQATTRDGLILNITSKVTFGEE